MNSFWRFLRDKSNQQVLGWLGGDQFAPLPFRVVDGGRQCSPRGS